MTPSVTPSHTFLYDTVQDGVWYVMRPKQGLGARAIPTAVERIEKFNAEFKKENNATDDQDFITAYAPRYRYQVSVGVYRERYVFSNLLFVHATAITMSSFMKHNPYQLFYITDMARSKKTNTDEYGNLTHDQYMRVTSRALADLFLSLGEYSEDIRLFTALELQELKYTRKVLIVDGPFKGRVCHIKNIEGKKRVILDLYGSSLSVVVVMPDTHFQRV